MKKINSLLCLFLFLGISTVKAQIITTIAGNGTAGLSGDGGQATAAELNGPYRTTIDATAGNMFIADASNNRVRIISASGSINTFAGNGTAGFSGDGGQS